MMAAFLPEPTSRAVATAKPPCWCGKPLSGKQTVACSDAHRFRRWSTVRPRVRALVRKAAGSIKGQVLVLLTDGQWWTKRQMADAIGCDSGSVASKVRDLRCKRFGTFNIVARPIQGSREYEYQLRPGAYQGRRGVK
jgi:hypothetical protein